MVNKTIAYNGPLITCCFSCPTNNEAGSDYQDFVFSLKYDISYNVNNVLDYYKVQTEKPTQHTGVATSTTTKTIIIDGLSIGVKSIHTNTTTTNATDVTYMGSIKLPKISGVDNNELNVTGINAFCYGGNDGNNSIVYLVACFIDPSYNSYVYVWNQSTNDWTLVDSYSIDSNGNFYYFTSVVSSGGNNSSSIYMVQTKADSKKQWQNSEIVLLNLSDSSYKLKEVNNTSGIEWFVQGVNLLSPKSPGYDASYSEANIYNPYGSTISCSNGSLCGLYVKNASNATISVYTGEFNGEGDQLNNLTDLKLNIDVTSNTDVCGNTITGLQMSEQYVYCAFTNTMNSCKWTDKSNPTWTTVSYGNKTCFQDVYYDRFNECWYAPTNQRELYYSNDGTSNAELKNSTNISNYGLNIISGCVLYNSSTNNDSDGNYFSTTAAAALYNSQKFDASGNGAGLWIIQVKSTIN